MVLRCLLITLSTCFDPFLDGLLHYNSCCMKCSIEAHIVVAFDPGSGLLQNSFHRHLDTVIDKFDCFCLQIWFLVIWMQLDSILIPQVRPPGFQILHKVGLGSWSNVSDDILSSEFSFLGAYLFLKDHYVSYLEWKSHLSTSHIISHYKVISWTWFLSFHKIYLPIDVR